MIPIESFDELEKFLRGIKEPMDDIWNRFWDWKLVHPDVEDELVGLARRAMSRGRKRYGISPIWEVLRWHLSIKDGKTEEFKCSNDYRSRYARYLMWKYEDLKDFFELRPLRHGVHAIRTPRRPVRRAVEYTPEGEEIHA